MSRGGPAVAELAAAMVGAVAVAFAGGTVLQGELGATPPVRAHLTDHVHGTVVHAGVAVTVLLQHIKIIRILI